MNTLEKIAKIIVPAAREELLPRFAKVARQHKADGSFLTEADLAVQKRVAKALLEQFPETVFLGEEMTQSEQVKLLGSKQPVWCLDPLDGTSNFAAGIPYFAISLSLLDNGEVALAVVYDPVRDELFTASQQGVASLNEQPLQLSPVDLSLKQSTALIDFKRLAPELAQRLVTEIPYASQRSFGSVALDWCWLAAGRCHVYLHGRSNIWDYSAGNYIFKSAGGFSTTLDGQDIFVNEMTPRSSVAAVDEALFNSWTEWLGITINK